MSRLMLGVMGHVDHGKTSLVRALTGTDTDRLPEEKSRGISIALGFAHMALPGAGNAAGDAVVDLIDMPGHERFVRTAIAGATGLDALLLVVAANEGIKPQTAEHVDVAALLGLRRVVVAVSKADLVDEATARATGEAAAALCARAGLQAGTPVLTSAATGAGLDALRDAIAAVLAATPPAADDGFAFLPVDRSFSIAGHGTVVTGTLRRGPLAAGDELVLLPEGRRLRVRGLQVHGERVLAALPGQRVAVNLRGVEPAAVGRGAALCARAELPPAAWLTVTLRSVPGAPPLPGGARLRLLAATLEVDARLRLLDRDVLEPGGTALAQLHCAEPVSLPARERLVLRRASPPLTVAGGAVLDPEARRERRHAPAVLARLAHLAAATPEAIVREAVTEAGQAGTRLSRLARAAGLSPARAAAALEGQPVLLGRDGVAVAAAALAALRARVGPVLARHPEGLGREALLRALPGAGPEPLDLVLGELARAGGVRLEGGLVRPRVAATERAQAEQDAATSARILDALRRGGLSPPDPGSLCPDPRTRRLLDRLVREGAVIRATDRVQKRDVLFHREAVEAARRRLAPLLAAPGLLVREAGEALGISRKFSVPLLEHLDGVGFTRRVADRRVLAGEE